MFSSNTRTLRWGLTLLLALIVPVEATAQGAALTAEETAANTAASIDPVFTVDWQSSDETCTQKPMEERLLEMVGPSEKPLVPVRATVQITLKNNRFVVTLTTEVADHTGHRNFEANTCKELQAGVALLLALILEASALPEPVAEPAPAAVVAPEAPPSAPLQTGPTKPPALPTPPLPTAEPPRSAPESLPLVWSLQMHALTSHGVVPEVGLGLGSRIGVQWAPVELAIVANVQWGSQSRSFDVPDESGSTSDLQTSVRRIEAELAACTTLLKVGRFSGALCVAVGLHQNRTQFIEVNTTTAIGPARLHGNGSLLGTVSLSSLFFSWEALLGSGTRHPLKATCPESAGTSELCETNQYNPDPLQFGLRAGIGTRF